MTVKTYSSKKFVSEKHEENHSNINWNNEFSYLDNNSSTLWNKGSKRCRSLYIFIIIIWILIIAVILLPVFNHINKISLQRLNGLNSYSTNSCTTCSLSLVESIPEGLVYPNDSIIYPSTFQSWLNLINTATQSIEIASFYWTLRQSEVYPDPSSKEGEEIFQSLLAAGSKRGIQIRIAQNSPSDNYPNIDTEILLEQKAAQVRTVNFTRLLGAGILHTKFWIIDQKHIYIGSANMDWRSLTQVKELGIVVENCTCLADDLKKIFEVYWTLGVDDAEIPPNWPSNFSTTYNLETPLELNLNNESFQTYISSSPPPFSPTGRTDDIDGLKNVIKNAEKFIYISVMDYIPSMIYTPKIKFWPIIDDTLKSAAIDNKVEVKLLISKWNHSRADEDIFLKSLATLNGLSGKVSIEVRRFIVPATEEQEKIPFSRVNHNKYMVTDKSAFIGTSNWSGDYFTNTAGVSFVIEDPSNTTQTTIRSQLQGIFERDWNSLYAHPLNISELQ